MYKFSFIRLAGMVGGRGGGGGGGGVSAPSRRAATAATSANMPMGNPNRSAYRQKAEAEAEEGAAPHNSRRGAGADQSQETRKREGAAEQLASGAAFENVMLKPFPIRAAIDVNNGQVTLAVARVDARKRAIRDLFFQSQLPVHVELETGFDENGRTVRTLSTKAQTDLETKCRLLIASMHREGHGITEVAGLLAWPFYELSDGGAAIAKALTMSLKVDFRVVGSHHAMPKDPRTERLERLRRRAKGLPPSASGAAAGGRGDALVVTDTLSPEEEMNQLAFLAFAAAGKVVDRSKMVALVEQPATLRSPDGTMTSQFCGGGLQLVGTIDKEDLAGADGEGGSGVVGGGDKPINDASPSPTHWAPLQRYQLPVDTMGAHAMLLRDVQRRDEHLLHSFSSPNPVHRREAMMLRNGLVRMLMPEIPDWVRRKLSGVDPNSKKNSREGGASLEEEMRSHFSTASRRGKEEEDPRDGVEGVLVGASENGGLLNTAARLVEKPMIGLETLEQSVDYAMCGLTDVLIGHNLPTPQLIVPQGCLTVAIMAACGVPRMEYLPRVSIAQAILVHPAYWSYGRQESIRERLAENRWYDSERNRTFAKPLGAERRATDPNGGVYTVGGVAAKETRGIARY